MVSTRGLRHAGIAGNVADGINAREPRDFLRILGGPTERHQSAATTPEHDGFLRETAVLGEFLVKRRVEGSSIRTAAGFADINPHNGDAGPVEAFKHPLLLLARQTRKRRRVPDPRYWTVGGLRRRKNYEGGVALHLEDHPRQRQRFLWCVSSVKHAELGQQ